MVVMSVRSLPWADFFADQEPRTVLFVTERVEQAGIALVRFSPVSPSIEVYPIPSDLPVEVMGGYGTYRVQAVYPLLSLEGKDAAYIRSTFSLSLGVLLDEVWAADRTDVSLESPTELRSFLLQQFWQETTIPLSQKLSWLALAWDRRAEVRVFPPLTALPAPELRSLGSTEQTPLCTVALVNTTPAAGLAGRIDQLLTSHNFRVVRTLSDTTAVATTTVVLTPNPSDDCGLVLAKLERLVPGEMVIEHDAEALLHYRADLVVKLGTDVVH